LTEKKTESWIDNSDPNTRERGEKKTIIEGVKRCIKGSISHNTRLEEERRGRKYYEEGQ